MKLKPLFDRVLVRPHPVMQEVRPSGIILLTDRKSDRALEGTVVATGTPKAGSPLNDCEHRPYTMQLKTGDVVLYSQHAGTVVSQDNEELLVMREVDCLAILEDDRPASSDVDGFFKS